MQSSHRHHLVLASFSLWWACWTHAGMLSEEQFYTELAGTISGKGEDYHAITPASDNTWTVQSGAFSNAQDGAYLRALPDIGRTKSWASGASVDYLFQVSTSGIYLLEVRWTGNSSSSDSIFFGILELADSPGIGEPDWYEDSQHTSGNFNTYNWDSTGEAEQNAGTAAQNPMLFKLTARDERYTLRVVMREDGVAIDSWRLVYQEPLPEVITPMVHDDEVTMRFSESARIDVSANDTDDYTLSSLEIVNAPQHGSAIPDDQGGVFYAHNGDLNASDSFSYRLTESASGAPSNLGTVTINLTGAHRFPSDYPQFPQNSPATTFSLIDALPGLTFNLPHGMSSVDGDSTQLFIAEADGYVWLVPDITQAAPSKLLFLDISDRVSNNGNEIAMKSITCHPNYSSNGYIYVTYNTSTARSRLSRFTRSASNPNSADPNSELILINQLSEGDAHSISTCRFGPDGYLYLGFGDEGTQVDGYNNSQHIDKDLFSGILRIDVDKLPGNLEPNADPDIPRDATGKAYFSIPNDNPFIGITEFNGQPVQASEVRTEFYMVGFRNPWQFNFLPNTDSLIVADVGRSDYEELSIIPRAGNGGWSWREGDQPGIRSGQLINGAAESDADLTPPIMSYSHSVGSSITGGLYYQNINYPGLQNRYIFADYVSGNVWATDPFAEFPQREFIAGEPAIVGFLLDPSDQGILLLDRGLVGNEASTGRVLKLKYGNSSGENFPATLTETNFFSDIDTLSPNPGVIAYEPNLRFWSDHATKQRWFHIASPTETITFKPEDPWMYPIGMVWAKHFELEMERGNPATKRRVETRFIIRNENGAYGVSYRWNDQETEAFLVGESGDNIEYEITDGLDTVSQQWRIPSRTECLSCHTETAGHALSFNTRQLNREGSLHDEPGTFITLLTQAGYLINAPADVNELPRQRHTKLLEWTPTSQTSRDLDGQRPECRNPDSPRRPTLKTRLA